MRSERSSAMAALAAGVAAAGGILAVLGPALAHLGVVAPFLGFRVFLLGALVSVVAMVLGGVALRTTRGGRGGRDRAWFAVAVGLAVLLAVLLGASAGFGLPRINDITTDPGDPPHFDAAARQEANRGRDLSYPPAFAPQQRAAYPDIRPIALDVPPAEAFDRARRAAESLGWEITLSDPEAGRLEARTTSWLFRFVDDVAIRVRPDPSGGSRVDVRSKSRDGQGDLGANAARIRAFAEVLRGGSPGERSELRDGPPSAPARV